MKSVILFLSACCCAFAVMSGIPIGNGKNNKNVEFKLIKTFGAEEKPVEGLLSYVNELCTDNNNSLYFIDGSKRLASFAPDGTFKWQINKNGQGPGDIENPAGLATDGVKFLYLSNVNGTRIDKFDLNGKLINSFKVGSIKNTYLRIAGFIKPNLLVTSKDIKTGVGSEVLILNVDKNYTIVSKFIIDCTNGLKLAKNASMAIKVGVSDDKIVSGNLTSFKLGFYNINGKEISTLKRNVNNLFLAYARGNVAALAGSISIPYKIKDNYYLTFMRRPTNITEVNQLLNHNYKKEHSVTIDIFSESGSLVYSKSIKGLISTEIGNPIFSDSEGYLYTFKEMPYPQICKYQVIISDKK